MNPRKPLHPRDQIVQTMARIYGYQLTTVSGGNLSIREPNGDIWITPAALDKGSLHRRQIVRVRPDGSRDGTHQPSSELPFHRAIYRARPDLRAIVHAHPVNLVAFSLVHKAPDTRLLPPVYRVCGKVGFAPYALPGSEKLGEKIAGAFKRGITCVIMENHGVVTGGKDLRTAFQRFEALEGLSRMIVKASALGRLHVPPPSQLASFTTMNPIPTSRRAHAPSKRERELRDRLCDFVHRGYQQRLLVSVLGSFSVRLGDDTFFITPHQQDRLTLEPADIVFVKGGRAESGKQPSTMSQLHRAIYRLHPDIQVIITASPEHATAFGVLRRPLEIRTIPESYVVLRRVARISWQQQRQGPDAIAKSISANQPVAILDNHGVVVTGKSILSAFDRLEVLEYTAQSLIHSRSVGTAVPIAGPMIRQLEAKFFAPSEKPRSY